MTVHATNPSSQAGFFATGRLRQILAPGVEDGRAAEITAERAGIAAEGGEGVRGGVEEEGVEEAGGAWREGIEGRGEGEDEMEVLDGQQLRAAGVEASALSRGFWHLGQ
jgi:hypothetical protein